MALRLVQANIKAHDAAALGRFWAEALGWIPRSVPGATSVAPTGFDWTDPDAPICIDVITVPDPETVHYRIHLELATTTDTHHTQLVTHLRQLGATPADTSQDDNQRTALTDPEGNTFCVLKPQQTYRDTGPIAAIVLDCADPRAMARFWGEAMHWTPHDVTDDHARLRAAKGSGPYLELHRTPHLNDTRHRIHLDVVPCHGDDQTTEVTRLQTLGATPTDAGQGNASWIVLTDPEGNDLCVLAPPDYTPGR